MASNNSRRSSFSNSDSGISCNTTAEVVDPRYACHWTDTCQGQHELNRCPIRQNELRGKLGIYYSPNGIYKRFSRDQINNAPLENNPTGCTMINLLIYKNENNQPWLLFVTKLVKQKHPDNREVTRQFLLTLPSSHPHKKNEDPKNVAARALESITNNNEIHRDLRSRLQRFFFLDASAIYSLYLTNEQANLLTDQFSSNEDVTALHWFPLSTVLNQLPSWDDYISKQAEGNELAQIRHPIHAGIRLNDDDENSTLWSVTATYLMCIENHVGFKEFLK